MFINHSGPIPDWIIITLREDECETAAIVNAHCIFKNTEKPL